MTLIQEPAAAKINLTLDVLGRRGDGYHELYSLVVFARDAGDILTLAPASATSLTITGPFASAIEGTNILDRAIEALRQVGVNVGAVALSKHLPIASGIGGGSTDAAALLRAVRRALRDAGDRVPWPDIAARLGADVPVCVTDRPAWMSGAGERVEAIVPFPMLAAVLVNPLAAVPADKTAQVFRALGLAPGARLSTSESPQRPEFASSSDVIGFVRSHPNALTQPACSVVPSIRAVLTALDATARCRVARMSGAGPTCFGLFDDQEAAIGAAAELTAAHPRWWVRSTRLS